MGTARYRISRRAKPSGAILNFTPNTKEKRTSSRRLLKWRPSKRIPAKFAPAFGGQCAYGHAVEKEFPVDPTNFKIEDGKLLLFLKNAEVDAKVLWEKEDAGVCMVKANRNWNKAQQD